MAFALLSVILMEPHDDGLCETEKTFLSLLTAFCHVGLHDWVFLVRGAVETVVVIDVVDCSREPQNLIYCSFGSINH
jgi:hypothetical protein